MELRKQVADIVYRAIRVNAWSDENCLKWADAILALPEIKEALAVASGTDIKQVRAEFR